MSATADEIIRKLTALKGSPPVIGGVAIHGLIGAGGMGAVFRGAHLRLKIPVAVKFLFGQDREDAARFVDEGTFAAKVNHPNVVRVYDVAEEDGFLYIVQEFVEGQSAARYYDEAQRGQPLTEDFVLNLGADVARGLAAMHAAGLLHLDIKPGNVLVAKKDGLSKILDLGAAQRYDPGAPADGKRSAAVAEVTVATPGYGSPEHLRGQRVGPSSDLSKRPRTKYAPATRATMMAAMNSVV